MVSITSKILPIITSLFVWVPDTGSAQSGAQQLELTADRCAIAYALTGRAIDGCAPPTYGHAIVRSAIAPNFEGYFVHFPFDSDTLDPATTLHLRRLGDLLNGALSDLCILMVGHTDTTGSASYNKTLSLRRAHAVKLYLAGPAEVAALRLAAVGRGEDAPLPNVVGSDGQNRRVEILAKPSSGGMCE